MAVATGLQAVGLSLNVYQPDFTGGVYTPRGTWRMSLRWEVGSWTHEIAANGGYVSASFRIEGSSDKISFWLEQALGWHVELTNEANQVIWEGFVNVMDAQVGTLRYSLGPVMNISNRVRTTYTPIIDDSVLPPMTGTTTTTIYTEDATSQGRYGTLERVLTSGTTTTESAEQYRDTYLSEEADPESSENIALAQSANASVTIQLRGYYDYLNRYYYENLSALTTTVKLKIEAILGADANSLFSTDYSQIAANAVLTNNWANGEQTALTILKAEAALGDINNTRFTLGVYNNQKVVYAGEPTEIFYIHNLGDIEQRIALFKSNARVWPWNLRPARWLQVSNFMVGRVRPGLSLREDPRNIFIESVRYTAPYTVQINGAKISTLPQYLAKKGLGGI